MSTTLPKPKARNLYLPEQVNQESMNKLTKAIIEINENDIYLTSLYALHNIDLNPAPIKMYIDSYGGAVYQCFGLLGVMDKSKTPIHTIVTGAAMSCGFMILISGHKRFGYELSTPPDSRERSKIWRRSLKKPRDFRRRSRILLSKELLFLKRS